MELQQLLRITSPVTMHVPEESSLVKVVTKTREKSQLVAELGLVLRVVPVELGDVHVAKLRLQVHVEVLIARGTSCRTRGRSSVHWAAVDPGASCTSMDRWSLSDSRTTVEKDTEEEVLLASPSFCRHPLC